MDLVNAESELPVYKLTTDSFILNNLFIAIRTTVTGFLLPENWSGYADYEDQLNNLATHGLQRWGFFDIESVEFVAGTITGGEILTKDDFAIIFVCAATLNFAPPPPTPQIITNEFAGMYLEQLLANGIVIRLI